MSTVISSVVLQLLAVVLPLLGINVGSEALTTTLSTLVVIGSGAWIWYKRVSAGDVNAFGVRKG